MADRVKKVTYCYAKVSTRAGQGARLLQDIREADVNLLAFSGFPAGRGKAQLDFVVENTPSLRFAPIVESNIKKPIGPEDNLAAVVVCGKLIHRDDIPLRSHIRTIRILRVYRKARHATAVPDRVVHKVVAVRREIRVEGQTQQTFLVGRIVDLALNIQKDLRRHRRIIIEKNQNAPQPVLQ